MGISCSRPSKTDVRGETYKRQASSMKGYRSSKEQSNWNGQSYDTRSVPIPEEKTWTPAYVTTKPATAPRIVIKPQGIIPVFSTHIQ